MARHEDTSILDAAVTEPTDRQTLAEVVTGRLRSLILDGSLPSGTPLRPAHLAPRLGVSVMPIREALRILEAEGLVTFTRRIGARVSEISEEDVEEIYLVRGALEGLATRLAVQHMTDDDRQLLHKAFDQMVEARKRDDLPTFSRFDREFHRQMYSASGRPSLVKKILELWDAGQRILPLTPRTENPMELALESHRAILDAVDRQDARTAERVTRSHTEQAADRLLSALRLQRDGGTPTKRGRRGSRSLGAKS